MTDKNVLLAQTYYTAMKDKKLAQMTQCLDEAVALITPLAETVGKHAATEAAEKLLMLLDTVTIGEVFSANNQAMLKLELVFNSPRVSIPVASLLTFKNDLIIKIELFYDPRKILVKKDEIFS